jgi:hypothetical protein
LVFEAVAWGFVDFGGGGEAGAGADGVKEAAADGVEVAGDEGAQGGEGGGVELFEDVWVFEDGVFEGEGASFVKEDVPGAQEALPEAEAADEDAEALCTGGGELFGEGDGDAEGARAGDDEDGDHDLERLGWACALEEPCGCAEEADEDDGDEVGAQEALKRAIAKFAGAAGFEEAA